MLACFLAKIAIVDENDRQSTKIAENWSGSMWEGSGSPRNASRKLKQLFSNKQITKETAKSKIPKSEIDFVRGCGLQMYR